MITEDQVIIPLHRPDLGEKLFFLFSGVMMSIPLTAVVSAFPTQLCNLMPLFYSKVCSVVILAPFIEEFSKAFPLFYRHGETGKSYFTLAFLVGMGFGITEFFMYVFGQGAPVILRLHGIFFHASSTTITIYGIETKRPIFFYLIAVALHLSYNFSTFLGQFWLIIGPAILVITYLLSWHLYHKCTYKIVS
jgi:RsiW-degrading membrane proteinase PrsW (M82 family)